MTNWYAVYTRPNQERRVVESLTKKRIEHYCPYHKVANSLINAGNAASKPLFTSYVFVRTKASELGELRKIDGVLNLVYWLDSPVVIRDIEVEMIRRFLSEHEVVELEKTAVNVSGMVKIISEDLPESEDELEGDFSKVKLVLPSLGYSLIANTILEDTKVPVPGRAGFYDPSLAENSLNFGL